MLKNLQTIIIKESLGLVIFKRALRKLDYTFCVWVTEETVSKLMYLISTQLS